MDLQTITMRNTTLPDLSGIDNSDDGELKINANVFELICSILFVHFKNIRNY